MSKILILRFSALGDVAMTIPVIYSLAVAYPMHEITVLSRTAFKPLFEELPANVHFVAADFNLKYKGLKGLNLLYRELKSQQFDYVADFHAVLRTHYLSFRFKLNGVSVARIDKGRGEKKRLTRKENKSFAPLKSSFIRYKDVLSKLGFEFELKFSSIYKSQKQTSVSSAIQPNEPSNQKKLGIAPFAKHKGKIYPLELQEQVIAHFAAETKVQLFIFGGGAEEKKIVDAWVIKYPTVQSMVGKLSMGQELQLIDNLDLMFSMDSANMHLAALVDTKVLSLWGATHPYAGFTPWNQDQGAFIQVDLACRPCSVFGNKICHRSDYACLYQIAPEKIICQIENLLF